MNQSILIRVFQSLCFIPGLLLVNAGAVAQENATIQTYFEQVREAYSGERALETVAFVAPHWRVAGNEGFNASIHHVAEVLERAGYVPEAEADADQVLTYRIERRPMNRPTWEPVSASATIVGEDEPLLQLATNRNMLTINSLSTPEGGVEAEVVYVGAGRPVDFEKVDVAGKIVFGETRIRSLFVEAVQKRGALGVLAYRMPHYLQPEVHQSSIQFSSIPYDANEQSWGILLSYGAKEHLKKALDAGTVRLHVEVEAKSYEAEELTLVADVRGSEVPHERFVFSAHVQEPGANDNASGVGVLAEIARVTADLLQRQEVQPRRSITFLWGDEITSTNRYIVDDAERAEGILWGLSLDMVGEDTEKTGGTFLIEKMPDPSAIWTRGNDQHSEWGGRPLKEDDMTPHYFNDFAIQRCLDQADATGWVVKTNPFEGGSDHTPFLRADKPGLLFWHFTDVYYHTDGDLIDKVSATTLENVGECALVTALTLVTADADVAQFMVEETRQAASERLKVEFELSQQEVERGAPLRDQQHIIETWAGWYMKALQALEEVEVGGSSSETLHHIEAAVTKIETEGKAYTGQLEH